MRSLIAFVAAMDLLVGVLPAKATTLPQANSLIKGSTAAVYYYGANGKRYVFPTEKTYFSWYGNDFSKVVIIDDVTLGTIPIGGNVTYRPGVKLLKITTDPKVYAIAFGGTLRWVKTEDLAKTFYGADWAKKVDDLPDPFFVNYRYGIPIENAQDYSPATETANAYGIWVDKGLPAN